MLSSYIHWLRKYTGKKVRKSTVSRSRFLLAAFQYKGCLVKPNKVLYNKFRPGNEARAYEFIYMLSNFAPERVKFGDEKSLKRVGFGDTARHIKVEPKSAS